jgi:hypothetical protein
MSADAYIKAILDEKAKKAAKGDGKRRNVEGYPIDKDGRPYRLDAVNGRAIYVDKNGNDISKPYPALPPPKPTTTTAATSPKPVSVPANYEGWMLNGVPYNGPVYQGMAMSKSEYDNDVDAANTDEKEAARIRKVRASKLTYKRKASRPVKVTPIKVTPSTDDTSGFGD